MPAVSVGGCDLPLLTLGWVIGVVFCSQDSEDSGWKAAENHKYINKVVNDCKDRTPLYLSISLSRVEVEDKETGRVFWEVGLHIKATGYLFSVFLKKLNKQTKNTP